MDGVGEREYEAEEGLVGRRGEKEVMVFLGEDSAGWCREVDAFE